MTDSSACPARIPGGMLCSMRATRNALLSLFVILALAGCGGDDGDGEAPAEPGDENAGRATDTERKSGPDADRARGTKLAAVALDGGRTVELWARGVPSEPLISPCLRLTGIGDEVRQCGTEPSVLEPPNDEAPIVADAYAQPTPSARLEVYGTTQPEVSSVLVEYVSDGRQKRTPAALLEATDFVDLEQAHISEPFGYFFGELPPETSLASVRAIALDSARETLGSADFGPLRRQHGGPEGFIAGPTP